MKKPWAKALGPQNTYAVVTILALLCTLPLVAVFDLKDAVAVYNQVRIQLCTVENYTMIYADNYTLLYTILNKIIDPMDNCILN